MTEEIVLTRCLFFGRTHRSAPTVGVVVPRYCRGRPACLPLIVRGVFVRVFAVFSISLRNVVARPSIIMVYASKLRENRFVKFISFDDSKHPCHNFCS